MATAEHLELEVTGVQVRVEKPSVSYKTKDNQNRPLSSSRVSKKNCCTCSKTCLFGIIQLLILATSLSALAISIAALQRPGVARLVQQDEGFTENSRMEANALNQLEGMLEKMGEMRFEHSHERVILYDSLEKRGVTDHDDLCYSSNETDVRPLAHIISNGTRRIMNLPNDHEPFSVLTRNWHCKSKKGGEGLIQGGMVFHRKSGFLELPVTGVYYVYSQVMFRQGRQVTNPRKVQSRMVACIPEDRCSGSFFMQTESNVNGSYGNSIHQGGLFHFTAGTQIAVLVFNELYSNGGQVPIRYNNQRYSTYMGAFLVD